MVDETGRLRELTLLTDDEEILSFIRSRGPVWAGIDASLVVPDSGTLRNCERMVLDRGIRILPTDRDFYEDHYGGCRGEHLLRRLQSMGFGYSDEDFQDRVYEVYPRAALHLMSRGKVPGYKKGPIEGRKEAMLEIIRILERTEPSLRLGEDIVRDIRSGGKEGMQGLTDKIDSLLSVASVYQHWLYGGKRTEALGDDAEGYILLPRPRC